MTMIKPNAWLKLYRKARRKLLGRRGPFIPRESDCYNFLCHVRASGSYRIRSLIFRFRRWRRRRQRPEPVEGYVVVDPEQVQIALRRLGTPTKEAEATFRKLGTCTEEAERNLKRLGVTHINPEEWEDFQNSVESEEWVDTALNSADHDDAGE